MQYFVAEDSIVRKIWGKSDTILFIFAGASAEFALNKAVDWLFFTGRLPADPLGRLFSTVAYARQIVFSEKMAAYRAIDTIQHIHKGVETAREAQIPDWAYRDVLFMLIDYSIRSYELLERKLTEKEKEEVFEVFYRLGDRMGIPGLPATYTDWLLMRADHLQEHLINGPFTKKLYQQYKLHLGAVRYRLLLETQKLVCPGRVKKFLGFSPIQVLAPLVPFYKLSRLFKADKMLKELFLPTAYLEEVRAMDKEAA